MKENALILAIETSCDETAAAVVRNGREVLSNIVASQADIHVEYGGVVPEIASRCHLEAISKVVEDALNEAGLRLSGINAIAVTAGPGLIGSLLVGVSYAKALAMAAGLPLIAVNHWEGHMAAVFLEQKPPYPFITLVASGSHSGLILADGDGRYRLLGSSLDDAAGEAFDKLARALGLGYPGGPNIEKAAYKGIPDKYCFPRAFLPGTDDFSFSGLKSSVLNMLNRMTMKGQTLVEQEIYDMAASIQEAICDVLSAKTVSAGLREGVRSVVLAGGVAANQRLRALTRERADGMKVYAPSLEYCTDNAAMIGAAAWSKWLKKDFSDLTLNADARRRFV